MTEYDYSNLTQEELIEGIKASKFPEYMRTKYDGGDMRETIAQYAAMTTQALVNAGMDLEQAQEWAMQLANKVDKGTITFADIDKNVSKLDATYFTDEFLNALSGGTINTTNVLDGTITISKLDTTLQQFYNDFSGTLTDENQAWSVI